MKIQYRKNQNRSKLQRRLTSFVTLAVVQVIAANAHADCTILRDDGKSWTDTNLPNCGVLYNSVHQCSASKDRPAACAAWDALMHPEWTASQDIVISPHRGIWGMTINGNAAHDPTASTTFRIINNSNDIPQNAAEAFSNAARAGFRYMEVDVVLKWDATTPGQIANGVPFMTHFGDGWGAANYPKGRVNATLQSPYWMFTHGIQSQLGHLRGNYTGKPRLTLGSQVLSVESYLTSVKNNQQLDNIVFVFDPKSVRPWETQTQKFGASPDIHCIYFCDVPDLNAAGREEQFRTLVKKIIAIAEQLEMEERIAFKVSSATVDPAYLLSNVPSWKKVLWVPQIKRPTAARRTASLEYFEAWSDDIGDSSVAFYEVALGGNESWPVRAIVYDQAVYPDITSFVKQRYGRRTGIWVYQNTTIHGQPAFYFAQSLNFGNDANATGGDILWSIRKPVFGRHALLTTDVPLTYSILRTHF